MAGVRVCVLTSNKFQKRAKLRVTVAEPGNNLREINYPRYDEGGGMHRSLGFVSATALVVGLAAACSERLVGPEISDSSVMSSADSAKMLAMRPQRPLGLALAPVTAPTMTLPVPTDSFTIELTYRECAAANNWVVLTSPVLDTLSSTMCQEPVNRIWRYNDGPYGPETEILLDFESGFGFGWEGQARFSDTLPVGFPEWNLEFEDAGDDDFDDFLLQIVAHSSDTTSGLFLSSGKPEVHPAVSMVCPLNPRYSRLRR